MLDPTFVREHLDVVREKLAQRGGRMEAELDSLAALERYNIVRAVTSGPLDLVRRWKPSAPDRLLPAPLYSRKLRCPALMNCGKCMKPASWPSWVSSACNISA